MERNRRELEVNFWDMIWYVISKWRSMLAVGILFAVIAAGISGVKSYKSSAGEIEKMKNPVKTEILLNDAEQARVDTYVSYLTEQNRYFEYMKESLLMRMDPNNFYAGKLVYQIKATPDSANNILELYKSKVDNGEITKQLMELDEFCDRPVNYVSEVVDTKCDFVDSVTNDKDVEFEDINPNGTVLLEVAVYGETETDCQAAMDVVSTYIDNQTADIRKIEGEFTLQQIINSVSNTSNSKLTTYQDNYLVRGNVFYNGRAGVSRELSEKEIAYIDNLNIDENEVAENIPDAPTVSINKKIVVVGGVFGFFLVLCIYVVIYVLNSKIRIEDDMEKRYGVKVLGIVLNEQKKKSLVFGWLDKFLLSARHLYKHYFARENAIEMIAANIKVSANKNETEKLFITGSEMNAVSKKAVAEIKDKIGKANIDLICGDPVLYNAEAFEKAADIGSVLLLENAGKSLYREIEEEIGLLEKNHINIVGLVVVEE